MIIKEKQESEILVIYQFYLSNLYLLQLLFSSSSPFCKNSRQQNSSTQKVNKILFHVLCIRLVTSLNNTKEIFFFTGRSFGKVHQCKNKQTKKPHCKVKATLVSSFSSFSLLSTETWQNQSQPTYTQYTRQAGSLGASVSAHCNFTSHCAGEGMHALWYDLVKPHQVANIRIRIPNTSSHTL